VVKPSGDHIPLGGFILRHDQSEFKIVSHICDGLGIVFDFREAKASFLAIHFDLAAWHVVPWFF